MASLREYQCPNCAGVIHFDPTKQSLLCPWCQTEIDAKGLELFHQQLDVEQHSSWEEKKSVYGEEAQGLSLYSCQSCGGEIIQQEVDITSRCPFCGNEVVNIGKISGDLKPDIIIPFQKTRQQAVERYLQFTKKKYVPRPFLEREHIQEIRGIYVPFWLFDAATHSEHHFKGLRSHTSREGDYRVTRTNYYLLIREGDLRFHHVPADASQQIDDTFMEAIEPFDYQQAIPFSTAYLAGFLANRYDVSANEVEERAEKRIASSVKSIFEETCDFYVLTDTSNSSIRIEDAKKIYALLPAYFLVTKYQDKLYTFAMNGQTGKFVGDIPADRKAVVLDILKWFFILALFSSLFLWYLMNR